MVDIVFLGHSSFKIKGKKLTILIDPPRQELVGIQKKKEETDVVLLTQKENPYHSDLSWVDGKDGSKPFVISGPGEYEISGCQILGIAQDTKESPEPKTGENIIYKIKLDDFFFLHLGSLGKKLSQQEVEELANVEILMIPVGGVWVLEPKETTEVIAQLEPKIVIPMHYLEEGINLPLKGIEKFLIQVGAETKMPQDKLSLTREKLPEETEIVVLTRQ
jgi:L-ascorbate metabolism protein UlaG (beta-lactamase superfamily)